MSKHKALVLFSGGLDSSTTLALAKRYFDCRALTFDYGQRHKHELRIAQAQAQAQDTPWDLEQCTFNPNPSSGSNSSLLNPELELGLPSDVTRDKQIPNTFVPGRNLFFLTKAFVSYYPEYKNFFLGANVIDYSGYPDCRPEFFKSLNQTLTYSVDDPEIRIHTPILNLSKKEIIQQAQKLKVNLSLTWSCYNPIQSVRKSITQACGLCDSCKIRKAAFKLLGQSDPIPYI